MYNGFLVTHRVEKPLTEVQKCATPKAERDWIGRELVFMNLDELLAFIKKTYLES